MKKEDWSVPAMIFEAVDILAVLAYLVLQIFYGVTYHIEIYRIIINILVVVLIYAGLTVLALYPENLNRLPKNICQGKVRKISLQLIRTEKTLFLLSLLIPCVCDVAAIRVSPLYNVAAIFVMLAAAVFLEFRVLAALKNRKK